jgi:GTP-binding protein
LKKLPRVAIVGFPNVGKSTLFNRLLKKKKSLVHSLPGMTRDRVSDTGQIGDRRFILVDTGGFFDNQEDILSSKVKEKAWEAAEEADVVLFILDGKRTLLPAEEELYLSMKKLNKPVLIVVNKIDSPAEEDKTGEFFRLGQEKFFCISTEHKRNLGLLESGLAEVLPPAGEKTEEMLPLKIAIVGRINVGKSSLINRLSGQEQLIVSETPGTTRDSTDTLILRNKKAFTLVDTAGIRKLSRTRDKREKASVIKAKKDIGQADVICLVLDAQEFPTRQDTAIAHLARDSGKPLIFALNKWDLIAKDSKSADVYKHKLYKKLEFVSYAPVFFVSALSGQRVVKILDVAELAYTNGGKKIATSQLNEFLGWIQSHFPPISQKKRKIKIKYMVQTGVLPPTFLLFTHTRSHLSPSYEKHFISLLRERFDFTGTPIRLHLKRN